MIKDSQPVLMGDLLKSNYFRIPRYQRPYSWERAHFEDFWCDTVQERSEEDYFIGSLVASKHRKDEVYAVVDGQQRITTATIFLCVIRNALEREGHKNLADGIHSLIERKNIRNEPQFVLTTESSFPFLQEHIQKRGKPELNPRIGPEELAIKAAFDFFSERIEEVLSSIKSDTSSSQKEIQRKIAQKLESIRDDIRALQVIFIELEDEDDAYLVFETLNTRGKDLRVSDLVKNLILRLKRPVNKGVDVGKEKWNKIIVTLEESEKGIRTDAFLHHSWLSRNDFVAQKKLFKDIKSNVTAPRVDQFLEELIGDSVTYRVIYEPTFRKRKWIMQELPIRDALVAIDRFGIKLSVPLILALMRSWEDGAIKLPIMRETILALDSFHMIFNAVTEQRATGGLAMMFASLANQLSNSKPNKQQLICKEVRQKLREGLPDYNVFKLAMRNILYTKIQTKHRSLVKNILERLSKFNNWSINSSELTIEHLLSQSSPGISETTIGQLGNLMLVPPQVNNEKLRDKNPQEKKQVLKRYQIPIPKTMDETVPWDKAAIEKHTDEIADILYKKIWRIP